MPSQFLEKFLHGETPGVPGDPSGGQDMVGTWAWSVSLNLNIHSEHSIESIHYSEFGGLIKLLGRKMIEAQS